MNETDIQKETIKLPERVTGSVELSRIIRELKNIDDWLNQAALRTPGAKMQLPKTSQSLEDLAAQNGVSLLDSAQRTQLVERLSAFSAHAPRIHMSFAVEPSATFMVQVISWLRRSINPMMLLEIGLQPNLAAGCIVRTENKLFDMSLRHRFKENRGLLVEKIADLPESQFTAPAAVAPAPEIIITTAQASAVPIATSAGVTMTQPNTESPEVPIITTSVLAQDAEHDPAEKGVA